MVRPSVLILSDVASGIYCIWFQIFSHHQFSEENSSSLKFSSHNTLSELLMISQKIHTSFQTAFLQIQNFNHHLTCTFTLHTSFNSHYKQMRSFSEIIHSDIPKIKFSTDERKKKIIGLTFEKWRNLLLTNIDW